MKCRLLSLVMAMLMLLTLLTACGEKKPAYENGEIDTKFDGKLEFDHAMELEYAKCFSVDYYKGGYKIAKTVLPKVQLLCSSRFPICSFPPPPSPL